MKDIELKNILEWIKPLFIHGNFDNVSNREFEIFDSFDSKEITVENGQKTKKVSSIFLNNNKRKKHTDEVLQTVADFGIYDEGLQDLADAIAYIKEFEKVLDEAKNKRYRTYKDKKMRYGKTG